MESTLIPLKPNKFYSTSLPNKFLPKKLYGKVAKHLESSRIIPKESFQLYANHKLFQEHFVTSSKNVFKSQLKDSYIILICSRILMLQYKKNYGKMLLIAQFSQSHLQENPPKSTINFLNFANLQLNYAIQLSTCNGIVMTV